MLERHSTYKGFDWFIFFTESGHRCGYIAIPKDHPLFEAPIESFEFINCHGGINFASHELVGKRADDEWIIGFDCGHYPMDAIDIDSYRRYFGQHELDSLITNEKFQCSGHVWTAEEVEEDIMVVITQLIDYTPTVDEDFLKKLDQIEQDFLDGKFKGGKI